MAVQADPGIKLNESDSVVSDALAIADKRHDAGILFLTPSLKLLYIDAQARDLCSRLTAHQGRAAKGILPSVVVDVCQAVSKALAMRPSVKDWEDFCIKQVGGGRKEQVLVRGVGLPAESGESEILVTVQAMGRRLQQPISKKAAEQFRLTAREITVLENLMKGSTNKEIALALGVTEQTVKEHIKHIMEKTRTSTRTAILVKLLAV
jgi:DNA-binding CsgD family transcriptional regulator